MSNKDTVKILEILAHADSGCEPCVSSLVVDFQEKFDIDKQFIIEFYKERNEGYWSDDVAEWFEDTQQ